MLRCLTQPAGLLQVALLIAVLAVCYRTLGSWMARVYATQQVAPDALLANDSGLDPLISPAYVMEQVARVARGRGLDLARIRALVTEHSQGRTLGFLGGPRVNLLELNVALDVLGQ